MTTSCRSATFDAVADEEAENPVVEKCVADALAPYRDLLPGDVLDEFREALQLVLVTHPSVAPLVERLRPRAVASASGERAVDDAVTAVVPGAANGTEGR